MEKRRVVHFHNLESDLAKLKGENTGPSHFQFFQRWIHNKNFEKLQHHEGGLPAFCQELWFLSPVDLASFPNQARPEMLRLIPPTFSSDILRWSEQHITQSENQIQPIENPSSPRTRHSKPAERPEAAESTRQAVLGFIGGFDFQPNIDSAKWILNRLVPALEKVGFQGKIQIAGRGAQAVIQPWIRSPLVEVLPDDFDINTFFAEISWMLVPHLTGSGVRIKLLDALARKIPVMATPSAVERLHPEIQKYPLIFSSDDPVLWADQAMRDGFRDTRSKYRDLAFPQAMRGAEIYRDV